MLFIHNLELKDCIIAKLFSIKKSVGPRVVQAVQEYLSAFRELFKFQVNLKCKRQLLLQELRKNKINIFIRRSKTPSTL